MIPVYKPYLKKYKESAIKCIEEEWISNHGLYVTLAGNKLSELQNTKYCVLMNNGTSATHSLFKALKFKYPDLNKIYVPNHVFVAPVNCALMEYSPEQIEILKMDPLTLNMDVSEEYLRSLEKKSCVVVVHNLGNIINVPRLQRLRPDLIFVEDNCEGLFGSYEGKPSGSVSLCSSVSFYGNKNVTTGEGGAFMTNDQDIYKFIKKMYSHGMTDKRYVHDCIGCNYRMTNIEAGFLYDQLNDIDHILGLKHAVFTQYDDLLDPLIKNQTLVKPLCDPQTQISYWMYTFMIPSIKYDGLERFMEQKNIQIRPIFYDLHAHAHLTVLKKSDTLVNNISEHGVMLPSYPELTETEQRYIVSCLTEYIESQ
jgi:perosamine synthetase